MVALAAFFISSHASYSTLAGLLCVVVPSAYYAWASQRSMVGSRIVAQGVLKIMGTGVGMALFLGLGSVQVPMVFAWIGHCADELFVGIGKGRPSRIGFGERRDT